MVDHLEHWRVERRADSMAGRLVVPMDVRKVGRKVHLLVRLSAARLVQH